MTIEQDVRDLFDRVYRGRRELFKVAIDPTRREPPVRIIVGDDLWAGVMIWAKRSGLPFEIRIDEHGTNATLFGLPLEVDRALMPCEVRFRSEITL